MFGMRFVALKSEAVHFLQEGGRDAYGHSAERKISHGHGIPCRHCLEFIRAGEAYLLLAWRPFATLQPYAETGPIFIHAERCPRATENDVIPSILRDSQDYIVRGYDHTDRIVDGTGTVTKTEDISKRAVELLARPDIAYIHVRSARNNCYQVRIDRD